MAPRFDVLVDLQGRQVDGSGEGLGPMNRMIERPPQTRRGAFMCLVSAVRTLVSSQEYLHPVGRLSTMGARTYSNSRHTWGSLVCSRNTWSLIRQISHLQPPAFHNTM
nr:hypothetical protein CFP56_10405 [Quercus suber]